jgi:hypothetical protein
LLPIKASEFTLEYQNQRLFTKIPHAEINLQVAINGLKLSATYSNVSCTIEATELTGCYNCLAGAALKHICTTDGDASALAHVSCDSGEMFSLTCGNGEATTRLQLQKAIIDSNCEVTCPAGTTTFQLKGELAYVARMTLIERITSTSVKKESEIDLRNFFTFFLKFSLLPTTIITTVVVAIALLCLIKNNPLALLLSLFGPQCRAHRHNKII